MRLAAAAATALASLSLLPTALEAHEAEATHPAPGGGYRFEPPPPGSYELPPIGRVSEHGLLSVQGLPAPLLNLAPAEVALVSFVYLSCGEACPLATATLLRVDRQLADEPELASRVQLVTVSFDPARDTPARMRALAESLHPRSRWRFLTPRDTGSLERLLVDFGQDAVWIPGPDAASSPDRLRHVLKLFLVDGELRVRNIYSTGLLDERLVMNDLRTLVAELDRE